MGSDDKYPEEQTYTKVDKRFTKTEAAESPADAQAATAEPAAASEAQAPGEPAPDQTPSAASPPKTEAQSLADLGVYAVLRFCVGLLAEQAWMRLGIIAPPGGETKQDLPQAKVAIDTLAFMVEKLQPDLDDSEKRELEATLANLRINYVQRAG